MKSPLFIPFVCLAAALTVCCGGGGGGTGAGGGAAYVAIVSIPEKGFANSGAMAGENGQAYGFYEVGPNNAPLPHAFVWNYNTTVRQDWNPSGFRTSSISGTDGVQQVGGGVRLSDSAEPGLIWNNSPVPTVLLPAGIAQVALLAVDNGFQVGNATPIGSPSDHPFLFNGTNSSVDLLPAGFGAGQAFCISGNNIGGFVQATGPQGPGQACMWTAHTAASFVNLKPAGYGFSQVNGISADQQVGSAVSNLKDGQGFFFVHALLWAGTAASAVDLNPSDNEGSFAAAVRNDMQVGYYYPGSDDTMDKACLWTGSAGSMVDLDQFISVPHNISQALAIDAEGRIYGYLFTDTGRESVVWIPKK